ncbi:MAG: RAD55 family ATPase [Halobacteriales archaeon]
MVNYVSTGVEGLDDILGGGIVKESAVLVSGNPGTGKSIFGMEFLYAGVTEFDERGIYLSFEENEADIRQAAESIGFDRWAELVEEEEIIVYDKRDLLQEEDFTTVFDKLLDVISDENYQRLVMDSLTMFTMFFDDEQEQRTSLLRFIDILKANGQTALLINEQGAVFPETEIGLENFLTDGNIYFSQLPTSSDVNRYVWVAKMRKQDFENKVYPMEISHGGITVYGNAAGFSLLEGGDGDGDSFTEDLF